MITLHEIPIYALSPETLLSRYENFAEKFRKKFSHNEQESFQRCLELESFPQRCWKHNHMVGSIDIFFNNQDIVFEVYLPFSKIERYHWKRSRKVFLRNIMANGTHFRVQANSSNIEIQTKIQDMLNSIIKDHIPNKYYVDREAFDVINKSIDYKHIFDNQKNIGEFYDKH